MLSISEINIKTISIDSNSKFKVQIIPIKTKFTIFFHSLTRLTSYKSNKN